MLTLELDEISQLFQVKFCIDPKTNRLYPIRPCQTDMCPFNEKKLSELYLICDEFGNEIVYAGIIELINVPVLLIRSDQPHQLISGLFKFLPDGRVVFLGNPSLNRMPTVGKSSNDVLTPGYDEHGPDGIPEITSLFRSSTTELPLELIEHFPFAILFEDAQRNITLVNEEFCRCFEMMVSPEALVGLNCHDLAQEFAAAFVDGPGFIDSVNKIIASGKPVGNQVIKLVNGKVLSRSYMPVPMGGRLAGHLWCYIDITATLKKQDEIDRERAFFQKVLDDMPADIAIFDADHRYLYVNRRAIKDETLRKWIIGKSDFDWCKERHIDPALADRRRLLFRQAIEGKKQVSFVDMHEKQGQIEHHLRIFHPLLEHNEVSIVIGYGANITEQKRAERLIEQEQERIRSILDFVSDAIFQCDLDGRIAFVNRSFLSLFQLKPNNDKEIQLLDFVLEEDQYGFFSMLRSLKLRNQPANGIVRTTVNRVIKHLDYSVRLLRFGNHHTLVGRFIDVTDRVQEKQKLEELIQKEQELNRLKTQFIRITSHELRTPLTTILSSAEILEIMLQRDHVDMNSYGKYTDRITREVTRMTDVLNDLIFINKIEDDKIVFEFGCHSLNEYVQSLTEELYQPYLDGRYLQLRLSADVTCVDFCKRMLRHAIINVVNNAFKFSADCPAPILSTTIDEKQVVLTVQDFGIGIPNEEIGSLYNPFFRGSNTGNIGGNGLGLMIAEYVVQGHGGKITLHSQIGVGTTINLCLPIYQKNAIDEQGTCNRG